MRHTNFEILGERQKVELDACRKLVGPIFPLFSTATSPPSFSIHYYQKSLTAIKNIAALSKLWMCFLEYLVLKFLQMSCKGLNQNTTFTCFILEVVRMSSMHGLFGYEACTICLWNGLVLFLKAREATYIAIANECTNGDKAGKGNPCMRIYINFNVDRFSRKNVVHIHFDYVRTLKWCEGTCVVRASVSLIITIKRCKYMMGSKRFSYNCEIYKLIHSYWYRE